MRLAALALLFFSSSQAVCATHILAGKALVKGLSNILNELPGNATQKASAGVPANFSIGASSGNLFCFPRYYAKEIETPSLMCPDGYSANGTTALAGIACIKQSYVQKQNCFRSMQCPANGQNMVVDELCMPSEVRSALIGMLVVFKVKAMLPFTILPLLKTALVKAVTFPIILPAKLIGAKVATGAMLANAVLNQTAGGLGSMDLAGMGFGGFKNKNNSLLELLGQLEGLKPNPAALFAAKFNQSGSMGVGATAGSSFDGSAAAADKDLGLLLAAAQLAALQKFSNQSAGGSVFGSMPESSGSTFTFGGLSDKDAQLTLLISQLAQLQAFNKSGMPILGASNMRMAAANTFSGGLFDKNSSSSSSSGISQLVEALKPNAVAMLASLIGSGSTGGFTGFADKGNASSVLQLVAQLEALKPNPAALLAALTDKNSTMQLIEQLAQMPVFNPAGALAALGLGGIMNKNTTLPQLIAQLEALKPNPAALLAGLLGGSGAGESGGFGDKNASLPLLLQLALQKPNPLAVLEAISGMGGSAFGNKNGSLPLLLQLALQKPNPLAVLEALSGGLGDKNGSLPLPLQLALQKFNMSMLDIPGLSMGSMTVMPELSITLGGGNMSSIFPASLVRQAASLTFAGGDVVGALMKGADPMELFTGSLLNINVNEIMNFLPQVNSWVSEHLQNLTHVNEITAQISANFPDCIYRCCKNEQTLDTSIALPTPTCNPGLKFNPITKLCVGASAGYANCPSYTSKCPASLPNGQPICVAETASFGLDTCKVLVLAQHTLPQHQCPA
uniref:Chitin-binding type-2 domain-containing protein n=1 Tax=Tetradesmus obliquus TaxID=3088 RepID=A0A383V672_TETOB|eukprot:jgi/Sobl393_1/6844/SZX60483.1